MDLLPCIVAHSMTQVSQYSFSVIMWLFPAVWRAQRAYVTTVLHVQFTLGTNHKLLKTRHDDSQHLERKFLQLRMYNLTLSINVE